MRMNGPNDVNELDGLNGFDALTHSRFCFEVSALILECFRPNDPINAIDASTLRRYGLNKLNDPSELNVFNQTNQITR